jgi:hypothetical protein
MIVVAVWSDGSFGNDNIWIRFHRCGPSPLERRRETLKGLGCAAVQQRIQGFFIR